MALLPRPRAQLQPLLLLLLLAAAAASTASNAQPVVRLNPDGGNGAPAADKPAPALLLEEDTADVAVARAAARSTAAAGRSSSSSRTEVLVVFAPGEGDVARASSSAQAKAARSAPSSSRAERRRAVRKASLALAKAAVLDDLGIADAAAAAAGPPPPPGGGAGGTGSSSKRSSSGSSGGSGSIRLLADYPELPVALVSVASAADLAALRAHPRVLGVSPNRVRRPALAVSLPLVAADVTAAAGNAGAGVSIAVIDTGVDFSRDAFGPCAAPGVPAAGAATCRVLASVEIRGGGDPTLHGTNVAGIASGVAPGAGIVSVKVFGDNYANDASVVGGIDWAVANARQYNITVINLSLEAGASSGICDRGDVGMCYAVAEARGAGILPVVASGNDAWKNMLASPACCSAAVAVGMTYKEGLNRTGWQGGQVGARCYDETTAPRQPVCLSNSGSKLELLAPGVDILAAGIEKSGTSMAAPFVAGAAAVLSAAAAQAGVPATPSRIAAALAAGGTPVTTNRGSLGPLVRPFLNVPRALELLLDPAGDATPPGAGALLVVNAAAVGGYVQTPALQLRLVNVSERVVSVAWCASSADDDGDTRTCDVPRYYPVTIAAGASANFSWTLPPGDGRRVVFALLRDAAGNELGPATGAPRAAVVLDTQPPQLAPGALAAAGAARRVRLSWPAAVDATSGVASYVLMGARRATPPPQAACAKGGAVLYRGARPPPGGFLDHGAKGAGLAEGQVWVYRLCAADAAGNVSPGVVARAYVPAAGDAADGSPPAAAALRVAPPATRSLSVSVVVDSVDDASGALAVCLSATAGRGACDPSSSAWTMLPSAVAPTTAGGGRVVAAALPATASTSFALPGGGNGPRTVYAWLMDARGNVNTEPVAAATTLVDTVAPTQPGQLSAVATGPNSVQLAWQAPSDAGAGVTKLVLRYRASASVFPPDKCRDASGVLTAAPAPDATATSVVVSRLQPKTTYSWRLCAADGADNVAIGLTARVATPAAV